MHRMRVVSRQIAGARPCHLGLPSGVLRSLVGPLERRIQPRQLTQSTSTRSLVTAGASYGAPFTNSISFLPVAASGGPLPPAQCWSFNFTLPDRPAVQVVVHARDTVGVIMKSVQDSLGVSCSLYSNGRRLAGPADEAATLTGLFGTAIDFDLDGVRYSVNGGLRLSPQGSTVKRTLLRSYIYLASGAATIVVCCVLFWNAVVPQGHNRLSQLQPHPRTDVGEKSS
jgi:hypothetical protein